jgi:hypothetical protein
MVNVQEPDYEQYNEYSFHFGEMSRCLLNIPKRSLPKLILSGVGLASKDTAGRVVCLACFQSST